MISDKEYSLREYCKTATNLDGDTFVGIKMDDGCVAVSFPMGYHLENEDKSLRKEILRLIFVLSKYVDGKDSIFLQETAHHKENVRFPIQAYIALVQSYMREGYYTEKEIQYKNGTSGKIHWGKTIKQHTPLIQCASPIYLEFVIKNSSLKDNGLITRIHEYCVYESFSKLGWLYTDFMPVKPSLPFDESMFSSVILAKLSQTHNEKNRSLFSNMLALITYLGNMDEAADFSYGTNRFEYVWEKLVDFAFGIRDKNRFFPRTKWYLHANGRKKENAALEPDTIMLYDGNVFVLDAKYYRYGITKNPYHLPDSSSINKQITYGEYIAYNTGKAEHVYNAFIMPYESTDFQTEHFLYIENIGEAISDWKSSDKDYERVQGILLDTRFLVHNATRENLRQIEKMSAVIKGSSSICAVGEQKKT
ncbi:LlaJI family restriction endonuclease [Eubacteriales bacterium OttesenSCG-928-A19]|nr:LlaJI family restriction endonuclease [Eubacteriales bacterium OttesenSCG-928-A19]